VPEVWLGGISLCGLSGECHSQLVQPHSFSIPWVVCDMCCAGDPSAFTCDGWVGGRFSGLCVRMLLRLWCLLHNSTAS
jgi:hypothetical protein